MSEKRRGTAAMALFACLLFVAYSAAAGATASIEVEASSPAPMPTTNDSSATTQPASAPTATMPVGLGGAMALPGSKDPGMTALNWNDTGNTTSLTSTTLVSSIVVIVLGGAGLFFVKRILPRVTGGGLSGGRTGGSKKQMRVLETTYLGSRKALHLVSVSGRTLLLAGCGDQLKLLADLTSEPILNAEREPDCPGREEAVSP